MSDTYANDFGTDSAESTAPKFETRLTQSDTLDKYGAKISARQLSKETGASAVFIAKLYGMGKIERHPATTDVRIFYTLEAIPIIKEIREQRALRGKSRITGKLILNKLEAHVADLEELVGLQSKSIGILQKSVGILESMRCMQNHSELSLHRIIESQADTIDMYDKAVDILSASFMTTEG